MSANRKFDLEDYIPVRERIEMFWERFPNGAIKTKLLHADENFVRVYAAAFVDRDAPNPTLLATGLAEEDRTGMVNRNSAVENAESSAIGRALANAGFATSRGPSREEMAKVQRLEDHRAKVPADSGTPLDVLKDDEAKELAKLCKDWIGTDETRKGQFKLKVVELGVVEPNRSQLWQVVQQLSPAAAVKLNEWMGARDVSQPE